LASQSLLKPAVTYRSITLPFYHGCVILGLHSSAVFRHAVEKLPGLFQLFQYRNAFGEGVNK
jgi:hypothetical protein